MQRLFISRISVITIVALLLVETTAGTRPAFAVWIDAATGQPVMTIPVNGGPALNNAPAQNAHMLSNTMGFDSGNPHAVVNGKNLFWDKQCQTWRDTATGKEILTIPVNGGPPLNDAAAQNAHLLSNTMGFDRHAPHAETNGKNLFWQPCPPPAQPASVQAAPSVPVLPFGLSIGIGMSHGGGGCGFAKPCDDNVRTK